MPEPQLQFDPEVRAEFLDESTEGLVSIGPLLVELELHPQQLDLLQAVFRPIHSIKGNAAFFGLGQVKDLAHELESLLDRLRRGQLPVSPPIITTVLAASDELRGMFERVRAGGPETDDPARLARLHAQIHAALDPPAGPSDLTTRALGLLAQLDQRLGPELQSCHSVVEELRALVQRACPTDAGDAAGGRPPRPLQRLAELLADPAALTAAHAEVPALLQALTPLAGDPATAQVLGDALTTYHAFIDSATGCDPLLVEILQNKAATLQTQGRWQTGAAPASASASASAPATASAAPAAPEAAAPTPAEPQKTMRVAESQIDRFLEYVGELLAVGDMLGHLQKRLIDGELGVRLLPDFRRTVETFDVLSQGLQHSIMAVRRLPARALLQRVPRLVRDVAAAGGKHIRVELAGEDLEIDKSLIDLLEAPLTHLVRNAADHGIEPPDARRAAGKPEQGTIVVSVSRTDKMVVLEVRDDGAGLNLDRIRGKAEALGLVAPGAPLTEADLVEFIFASGLSTAQKVTDVSGRGVGLDVVRRAILERGGHIAVTTQPQRGSSFRVEAPQSVNTQILNGYLLTCGRQAFVLPLAAVEHTAILDPAQVHALAGGGRCLGDRSGVLPVVALRQVLGLTAPPPAVPVQVTVLGPGGRRCALEVDQVLGVRQVVVRPIPGLTGASDLFRSGALLGNGGVALILDVERLLDHVECSGG